MTKFNRYAVELDARAKQHISKIEAAEKELAEAELKVKMYPKKAVITAYDTEYEVERLAADARLAKAKDSKQKAYAEAAEDMKAFYETERTKLKQELDNYYALDPAALSPETMEILNSPAANENDYKRLFEIAQANRNITMIRMIGAKAEEKAADYSEFTDREHREKYALCKNIADLSKGYTSDVRLADYDSQYSILSRCIETNSKQLLNYYDSEILPNVKEAF